jgi:hypothetical protein
MSYTYNARRTVGAEAAGAGAARGAGGAVNHILPASDVEVEPAVRHDGRAVGAFIRRASDGQVILRKHVDPTKHMLRQPAAWAIAEAHYLRLLQLGGVGVELLAADGRRWWASTAAFTRHALRIERDVDTQLALPLARWQADAPGARQLELFSLLAADTGGAGGAA